LGFRSGLSTIISELVAYFVVSDVKPERESDKEDQEMKLM
jgi:hypothetical protein